MKTKNKIIITISSICLAAAVILVGVFAFTTQTLSISNTIGFVAGDNVEADVVISSNKNATAIDLNGESEGTDISFSFSGEEIEDGESNITIPSQTFNQRGDYVETTIEITNNGDYEFAATLDETTLASGKPDQLALSVTYTLDEQESENGATVTTNSVFVITIRVSLESQLTSLNWTYVATVTLGEASENGGNGGNNDNPVVNVPTANFSFGEESAILALPSDLEELLVASSDFSYIVSAADLQSGEIGTGSILTLALSRTAVVGQISNGYLNFAIDLPEGWVVSDGTDTLDEDNLSLAIATDKVTFYLVNSTENLTYTCNIYLIDNLANFKVKIESGDNYSEIVTLYRSAAGDYFTLEQSLGFFGEVEEDGQEYEYLALGVNIDSESFYTIDEYDSYNANVRITQGPNVEDISVLETPNGSNISAEAGDVATRLFGIDTTNEVVEGIGISVWLDEQVVDFIDLGFTDYAAMLAGDPMELQEGEVARLNFGDGEIKTVVFDSSLQDFFGLETNCSYQLSAQALETGVVSEGIVSIAVNVDDVDISGGSINFLANIADGWTMTAGGNVVGDTSSVGLELTTDVATFTLTKTVGNDTYTITCNIYVYDEDDSIVSLSSQGRTITLFKSAGNDEYFTAESTYAYYSAASLFNICASVDTSFYLEGQYSRDYVPLTITYGANSNEFDDYYSNHFEGNVATDEISQSGTVVIDAIAGYNGSDFAVPGIVCDNYGAGGVDLSIGYVAFALMFAQGD